MRIIRTFVAAAASLVIAGCTVEELTPPALSGPSEFALSVTLAASPDQLPRDGSSQSVVTVTVRDVSGRPVAGQRLNILPNVGRVSEADVTTGSNGQASFTFTAPPPGTIGNFATIQAVPVGNDAGNAAPRDVSILLTGGSNTTAPTPSFTVMPAAPEVNTEIRFDASQTTDEGSACLDACSYYWNFGDGSGTTGRIVSHSYSVAKAYLVTLAVTDIAGTTVSIVRTVNVTAPAAPTVVLTVAPDPPYVNQQAVLTASATAAPGHSIQRYEWDFGDGTSQITTTPTVTKMYATVGIYVVTVAAIDDLGQAGRAAKSVNVGYTIAAPVANFTVSPTSPTVGANVTFNGSLSTVGAGATIVNYLWDLGDGSAAQSTGTISTLVASYGAAGTYTVTLTITDSLGRIATKTLTVTVA